MASPPPDDENGENELQTTFSCAMNLLSKALDKLKKQNIKTPAAVKISDEVCDDIRDAHEVLLVMKEMFQADYAKAALFTFTSRFSAMEKEIRDIKANTTEIKANTL
jgi:hypothetical protein